jgi:hypothetical protein
VLVLDGVRTDEFTSAEVSNLTGMTGPEWAPKTWGSVVGDATLVRAALNQGITITAPAHVAMVTGRAETFANFPLDPALGAGFYRPTVPTMFEEARTQLGLGADDVAVVANTELLYPITDGLYPGYGVGARFDEVFNPETGERSTDDADVMDELDAVLDAHPPRLTLVNLHQVDRDGHHGGEDDYKDDVQEIDGLVASFWNRLQARHPEYVANLLLIVTADHGRHRNDEPDSWHNHGDACDGCREVPLLLLGVAHPGEELTHTVSNLDLAPTIAAHLGFDLPWGEGLPLDDVVDDLGGTVRQGDVAIATAGEHEATQRWVDDTEQRSEVVVDGTVLSTPGIYAAEDPALVETTTGALTCFRELSNVVTEGTLPWAPRCLAEADGTWTDVGFPDVEVGPFFRSAMVEREGRTWAAWPADPHGDLGGEDGIGLAIEGWSADAGWADRIWARAIFPTDVALAPTTHGLVAAVGTSLGDPDYRYTRRVRIVPVSLADGYPVADVAVDFTLTDLLGDDTRVEHPALTATGDEVRLALLGTSATGTVVATAASHDGGLSWDPAALLPSGGDPLPYLAPAWDGDEVVWGVLVDGAAALCRAAPGAPSAACVDVGSPRIHSFTVQDGIVTVIRDAGIASWERAVVVW